MAGFQLTKAQAHDRLVLVGELAAQKGKVEDAVGTVNHMIDSAIANELIPEIDKYNALLVRVREFCEGIASEHREKFDAKSEGWQEGEKGDAAGTFVSAWEEVSFSEDIEHPSAPEIELEDVEDDHTTLEELPEQAE